MVSVDFSVVSFNVLSNTFSFRGRLHGEQYPRSPIRCMLWSRRFDVICQLLRTKLNADIICLQEVDVATFNDWAAFFEELKFGFVLQDCSKQVCNLTAYRLTLWQRVFAESLGRSLVLGLSPRTPMSNGLLLSVVNVHLVADPPGERKEIRRLLQLQSALRCVDRNLTAVEFPNLRLEQKKVIVTGDFNSEPASLVYRLLIEGTLRNWDGQVCFDVGCKFKSALAGEMHGREPITYVSPHGTTASLDFIFYRSLTALEVTLPCSPVDGDPIPLTKVILPNDAHPSDHFPVMARFSFD